jgi:outer membrane protein OmpA-like peptidoglycan-associated protein
VFKSKAPIVNRNKEEGEKPFWISFSDLMTALMVLFLLVMSVALLAITKEVSEAEKQKLEREAKIKTFESEIDKIINEFNTQNPDSRTQIRRRDNSIDLGRIAFFEERSNDLNKEQSQQLRMFVKKLIPVIKEKNSSEILKDIQVIGFTNKNGDYLYNLNLSLQRSHRLVCILLQDQLSQDKLFDINELNLIKDYFLVSGYAFNNSTESERNDRRIELLMNYIPLGEEKSKGMSLINFGVCHI